MELVRLTRWRYDDSRARTTATKKQTSASHALERRRLGWVGADRPARVPIAVAPVGAAHVVGLGHWPAIASRLVAATRKASVWPRHRVDSRRSPHVRSDQIAARGPHAWALEPKRAPRFPSGGALFRFGTRRDAETLRCSRLPRTSRVRPTVRHARGHSRPGYCRCPRLVLAARVVRGARFCHGPDDYRHGRRRHVDPRSSRSSRNPSRRRSVTVQRRTIRH